MAIKESRQGISIALSAPVDAADGAPGSTLCPDPVLLFPSPENEFRGELLNQRWTCGEKISSCEGAASLHGARIKVSREHPVSHQCVLQCGEPLPQDVLLHPLWTRWSRGDGAFLVPKVMGRTWKSLSPSYSQTSCVVNSGLPAAKIWL